MAANAMPVSLTRVPAEGPMGLQLQLDFTHGTTVQQNIDLTAVGMSCVQCMWVDNTKNPNFLKFQVGGDIGYITVPALTQGYYPLIQFGPAFSFGAFTAGAYVIPVVLLNVDMTPALWTPSSGGAPVVPGSGNLTPSAGFPYIIAANSAQVALTAGVTTERVTINNPADAAGQNIAAAENLYVWLNQSKNPAAAPPSDATSWNVYVSNTAGGGAGSETLQASNIAIGTNWQEPNTGLVAGAAFPRAGAGAWGTLSPCATGALGSVVSGALGATTYYVKATLNNNNGESVALTEATLAVAANSVLTVASPAAKPGTSANGWIQLPPGASYDTGSGAVPLTSFWVRAATYGHLFTAYTIENTNY